MGIVFFVPYDQNGGSVIMSIPYPAISDGMVWGKEYCPFLPPHSIFLSKSSLV